MAGYMAARGDFVTEYESNAELLVTDLDFPTDQDADEQSKWLLVIPQLSVSHSLIVIGYSSRLRI